MVHRWLLLLCTSAVALSLAACRTTPPVDPSVLSVRIDQGDREVVVGASLTLTATVEAVGGASTAVTWSSGDEDVVVLAGDGVFQAVGAGEAIVTAASVVDEHVSASVTIGVVEPTLLVGDADAPATGAMMSFSAPFVLHPDEVSAIDVDGEPVEVLRTEIFLAFMDDVTVGDVNRVLKSVNGTIVSMTPVTPNVVARIPDPGSLVALQTQLDALEALPEVRRARITYLLDPFEAPFEPEPGEVGAEAVTPSYLPPNLVCDPDDVDACDAYVERLVRIDHHLAVRGHASWNAAAAWEATAAPTLVVADFFGDGSPDHRYAVTLRDADFVDATGHHHGYHVLGIMVGSHEATTPPVGLRDQVVGLLPGTVALRVVDLRQPNMSAERWRDLIVGRVLELPEDARVVLNTSLNSKWIRSGTHVEGAQSELAWEWAREIRAQGLEERLFHATSAGNVRDGVRIPARENSFFANAALTEVQDPRSDAREPPLRNTVVVENRVNTLANIAAGTRPMPGCGSNQSYMGGHLSAMGSLVFSFGHCLEHNILGSCVRGEGATAGTSLLSGTSMATPQVAALAAMAWTLAPDLSAPQLRALLVETSRDLPDTTTVGNGGRCNPTAPAPVIDALDAVLRAGGTTARRALLDVTGDGRFDEADIATFVREWIDRGGALDFSRFDLNGSGRSGGDARERFDLTMDGRHQDVQITIDAILDGRSQAVTISVDEDRLTDLEILCFYAFDEVTGLYVGDAQARRDLIGTACATGDLEADPGTPIRVYLEPERTDLEPGGTQVFTATVTGTDNVAVNWGATCGTISGSGNTVTYTAPTSEGTCLVRATSVEDTGALGEATVLIQATGSPQWRASPTQLDFFADVGDPPPASQTFTLHNDGSVEGTFSLNAGGMTQVSPDSGTIAAGGSQVITVSVTACPDPGTTTSLITLPDSPVTIGVSRTCGEPEPDVGMIQVIISGLPSGVNADVYISGQGWMLWPTSSVLLSDMQPGWYEMTAAPVTAEGATYEPDPTSKSFLVVSGQTTTVAITYSLTSVDPGQLAIAISGLPSSVNANVRVTGPDGFSRTLTSSTTLTVPPGTYTITGNDVTSGGTTYAPTPTSQQRTVSSNASSNATVTYAATLVPVDVWFNIGGRGSVRVGSLAPCTADCTRSVPPGQPVSIVATADAGFQFTGWADACEHAGSNTTCTITPTAYTRVIANFAQRTITIDYTKQGSGSGSMTATFDSKQETCSDSCSIGPVGVPTVAILQATAAPGHTFGGWGGACAEAGTNALCTLSLLADDGNQSVSARFDVTENRPPTIDEVWLRYQSGERFECGSIIPQEYIGFHWRSSDPDGDTVTHQYRVDNGTWRDQSGTSVNLFLDDKPPGTLRTLQVRAIDSHGNMSATASCTARVSVPPEIMDYAGPTDELGYRVGETAAFAVNVRDADGHYPSEVILMLRRNGSNVATIQMALQFDQGPATKLTYVATYRFTVEGSYDYLIWVTDALGVMADATNRIPFTIYP